MGKLYIFISHLSFTFSLCSIKYIDISKSLSGQSKALQLLLNYNSLYHVDKHMEGWTLKHVYFSQLQLQIMEPEFNR
ncbi:hypothetical protein XELAEV_18027737mg [Xenopus laevis]|uniref:Uncharacterized protein n=1 Tax=Xenopus laevis TaxID=8355 RepID=A0A974CVZ4_XENLA|nr:hypothetical protein XELAEV_18027737mg [Xenopus laevis]